MDGQDGNFGILMLPERAPGVSPEIEMLLGVRA
jgi:hypothetical protein